MLRLHEIHLPVNELLDLQREMPKELNSARLLGLEVLARLNQRSERRLLVEQLVDEVSAVLTQLNVKLRLELCRLSESVGTLIVSHADLFD